MRTSTAILVVWTLGLCQASGNELSGQASVEGRYFVHDGQVPDQTRNNGSFAMEAEYYHEWENGLSFTLTPLFRLDSADAERTHFDVRELNLLWPADQWELRVGIGKVFWGATEFVHLVDIVNQTDLVEDIDGEEKLGQPMLHLSVPSGWGVVDAFVLPYFRERTFPGPQGRLRSEPAVETGSARYESSAEERHVDLALRYSHSIGSVDCGLYQFRGTGREPTLIPADDGRSLIPFYEQIDQTGLDVQVVAGEWLFKLEAMYRCDRTEDFFATVSGFEYTFVRVLDTSTDLGVILEYAYDDRGKEASSAYQNDIMLGLRAALNDAAGSELLAGLIRDTETGAYILSVEASRRIGANWKLNLEAWVFNNAPRTAPLYALRDDDFLRVELACYF